jgi:hypothetical protein
MRLLAVATLFGLGCSNYSDIRPSNPVPGWAQDEISCDVPPACEGDAAAKCLCADLPAWQLQDVNQNSDRFTETYGLDAFAGKVTVLSFYKVNCDFCGQQMGYLQVMQDQLAAQGFDVAFATLLKKTGEIGTTCEAVSDCENGQTCEQGFCHSSQQKVMSQQRNSYGACALFDSPNCDGNEMTSQITIKYPVFQDTDAAYAWQNDHGGGSKDEIYVYRPDGKLAAYFRSASDRLVFASLPDYRHLRATLKALSLGKIACDSDNLCGEGQWCRQPELGTCGGSGFCVPQVEADDTGAAICAFELYPTPVCGCDQSTYGSACAAASSGVSLYDNGHCLD